MDGLLDLPEARQRLKRWTVAEYEQLADQGAVRKNVELIRGLIVEKMSKSPLHRYTALALFDAISKRLPTGYYVMHEAPLRLTGSEPEPDLSVVHGHPADFLDSHPTTAVLVIEVAVTSPAIDRENASLYAEAGVAEYWIVLPRERQVEIYRDPRGRSYALKHVCSAPAILTCGGLPNLTLDLGEIFPPPRSK